MGKRGIRARRREGEYGEGDLRIAEWRTYRNLSQVQLAGRLEMSQPMVSALENGGGYHKETLVALAHAFDCEVADLFRDPNGGEHDAEWRRASPEDRRKALAILRSLLAVDRSAA